MRLFGKYDTKKQNREHCAFFTGDGKLWVFLSDDGSNGSRHRILKVSGIPGIRHR